MDALILMSLCDNVAQEDITGQPQIRAGPDGEGFGKILESIPHDPGTDGTDEDSQGKPGAEQPESATLIPKLIGCAVPVVSLDPLEVIGPMGPAAEGELAGRERPGSENAGRQAFRLIPVESDLGMQPRVDTQGPPGPDALGRADTASPAPQRPNGPPQGASVQGDTLQGDAVRGVPVPAESVEAAARTPVPRVSEGGTGGSASLEPQVDSESRTGPPMAAVRPQHASLGSVRIEPGVPRSARGDSILAGPQGDRGEWQVQPARPATAAAPGKADDGGNRSSRDSGLGVPKLAEAGMPPEGRPGEGTRVPEGVEVTVDSTGRRADPNRLGMQALSQRGSEETQPALPSQSEAAGPAVREPTPQARGASAQAAAQASSGEPEAMVKGEGPKPEAAGPGRSPEPEPASIESQPRGRSDGLAAHVPAKARPASEAERGPGLATPEPFAARARMGDGGAEIQAPRDVSPFDEASEPIRQVAHEIRRMVVDPERQTAEIRLVPEHLGRLRLEVRLAGDRVHVSAFASTPQAQAVLDSGSADLRESLEDLGYSLESFEAHVDQNAQHQANEPKQAVSGLTAIPGTGTDDSARERTIAQFRDPERLLDLFV